MRLALLVVLVLVFVFNVGALSLFDKNLDDSWKSFKNIYDKQYKTRNDEDFRRLIWEKNLDYIQKHNSEANNGQHTFFLKINKFGDMTNDEFKSEIIGKNRLSNKREKFFKPTESIQIPDAVDWRTQGYVSPIKDQGQCGSSWAFGAVTALEGQHFKYSNKLVELSVQNLLDCSGPQGNQGCNGGYMDQAFAYVKVNKGIDTEASYPYEAVDGKCRFNAKNVGATCTGFVDIQPNNETDLTYALATIGPVANAVDASQTSFQFYSSGIYYEPQCNSQYPDHGTSVVGYGTQGKGKDFYIVRNQWGTTWGMDGYILMSRNRNNNCGVATIASYPLLV